MDRVTGLMREGGAGEIVPRFARLGRSDVGAKTPGDLVTVADLASWTRFCGTLPKMLGGSRVLGEEAVANNPGLLSMLDEGQPVWVVDPLDGTGNFSAGLPIFTVIVAQIGRAHV